MIFESSMFPTIWQKGLIVHVHKKGTYDDVKNYRGVTLLSVLGKLFTKILNNRLVHWSDSYEIVSECQFGFRKGRSTVDAVFLLQSIVETTLENNKLYTVFIDFAKENICSN